MSPLRLLAGALLLGAGALASTAPAGVVALDARSFPTAFPHPAGSPEYAGFRTLLSSPNHTLVSLTSFTSVDLAGVDLLVLLQPENAALSFTAQEIADVGAFVQAGGHLWFVAEAGGLSNATLPAVNAILMPHGVTVTTAEQHPQGFVVAGFVPHPVTEDVQAIGLDYHRTLTVTAPALDLTTSSTNVLAVVPAQGGAGRVAVVTDATFLMNPGFGADHDLLDLNNRKLIQNLVTWFLPPFHDGCPGTGGFVPKFTATTYAPAAGATLGLKVEHGLGGAPATFFFGLAPAAIPMVGGCTLNVAPVLPASFTVPLTGAGAGQGTLTLSGVVPANASGATFAMQVFVTDPGVPHGFSNSNEIVIDVQ